MITWIGQQFVIALTVLTLGCCVGYMGIVIMERLRDGD